ncbi:hypothetical protein [Kribbella sp. NPDC004875]|uniref:hypothetical protein n=1 Tax=Kribbella sp. NPDC004875 TaxID=3364107 RepID=UPI00368C0EA7
MSDPTTPADPKDQGAPATDAGADTAELAAVPAGAAKAAADPGSTADTTTATQTDPKADPKADPKTDAKAGLKTDVQTAGEKPKKKRLRLSGAWLTVGGAVVILIVLALLGYVWGLGPLNRLNTSRGINPPAKLAGLDRITDKEIRDQLQLDQTREALSRINDGKQATVEAYGTVDGDRMYVIIALRGKVDIDKTVADSGATPDKIKKVGSSTCVESTGNLPTQCYRGSNTLTVIAQSANEGVNVDQVEPVAEEAFKAMR